MTRYAINPHPGCTLKDILENSGTSQTDLAQAINVEPKQIADLVDGKVMMTPEMDLLLTRHFGLSDGLFMRLHDNWARVERYRLKQVLSFVPHVDESLESASEVTVTAYKFHMVPEPFVETRWIPQIANNPDSGYGRPER